MNTNPSASVTGYYDTHIHAAPDIVARCGDDIDIARGARAAGLAGIVLKNHIFPTGARALLTKRAVSGIEVAGGIVLNSTLGFTNSNAVEHSFAMGGQILWMATRDARLFETEWNEGCIDTEELSRCLRCVARNNGVLGTGHLHGDALRNIVETAREVGVSRIVLNHPDAASVGLSLEEQAEYAQMEGVWLERTYLHLLSSVKKPVTAETVISAIRATGIENNIIATDLGRTGSPAPWKGLAQFCQILTESGFSNDETALMGRENPRGIYFSGAQ